MLQIKTQLKKPRIEILQDKNKEFKRQAKIIKGMSKKTN